MNFFLQGTGFLLVELVCLSLVYYIVLDPNLTGFLDEGNSGMGRYQGKSSFDTFSHHRSVLDRSMSPLSEKLGEAR